MKRSELKEMIKNSLLEDMGMDSMSLESLESMLKSHDWYYDKSDDSRVYRKGNSEERMIKMEMQRVADAGMAKEAMELYKKYAPEGYTITLKEEEEEATEVFTDAELDMASKMLMGMFDKLGLENNVEKSDALVKYINSWFEGLDFVNEAEEDVEIEDDVEVTADEKEGIEVTQDAESDVTGIVGNVQDNLEAALESARELGDEKLVDQIGNTLTFFTRTHVVKEDEQVDINIDSPAEDAEVGMKLDESIVRMQKLAGLIK